MTRAAPLLSAGLLILLMASACAEPAAVRRNFALDVLQEYAPDGYEVVSLYESTPWSYALPGRSIQMSPADFMVFVRGSGEMDTVASLPTAVHETCHNFARKMPWYYLTQRKETWRECLAIPMRRGEVALVPITPTFPTKEIVPRIPATLRDIRFDIYVNSKTPEQTTQQSGVYGLLDEFNAYQQGTRTALDLEGWYAKGGTPQAWERWRTGVEGLYSAHPQFKLFILAWLAQAREKHPEAYRAFLENRTAVETFLRVDVLFSDTIKRYFAGRPAARASNPHLEMLARSSAEISRAATVEVGRYAAIERALREAASR